MGGRNNLIVPTLEHALRQTYYEGLCICVEVSQHDITVTPPHEPNYIGLDHIKGKQHGPTYEHLGCADVFYIETDLCYYNFGIYIQGCVDLIYMNLGPSFVVLDALQWCAASGSVFLWCLMADTVHACSCPPLFWLVNKILTKGAMEQVWGAE